MGTPLPQLSAHKGLRGQILLELKRAQPLTATELAATLGVSPNAVRHHLKELEAEQLIAYGREQRGVGAPTFAYRLSADGEGLFPRRYEQTLTEVLDRIATRAGRDAAIEIFRDHYADLARQLTAQLAGVPAERRLTEVVRVMSELGYMAEWQAEAGAFSLSEHNCAIRAVAERFPEVCAAEEEFLQTVLGAAVERRTHIVQGCNACQYHVSFNPPAPAPESV
jgi:DeoR family suf operon transcriptional repressor